MRLIRRPTRQLSLWMAVVLLLAQWTALAHACPIALPGAVQLAMAGMPDCPAARTGRDAAEATPLCQAHCQHDAQNVHPAAAHDAPASPLLIAVLDWRSARDAAAPPAAHIAALPPGAVPPGAPPRFLALQVLRN